MAFYPYKTLSGAAFPIQSGMTAGAAIAKGDIVKNGGTGDKLIPATASEILSTVATEPGTDFAVALNAAAADGDKIDVCLITPDVQFRTTATTGTPNILEKKQIVAATMNVNDTNISTSGPYFTVLERFTDSAGTVWIVGQIFINITRDAT